MDPTLSCWWGAAFLLVPGTLPAIERMGIDGPLAAITMGFCYYVRQKSRWRLFLLLVCAALVRESGLLLIAAAAMAQIANRDWKKVLAIGSTAIPAFSWILYVNRMTLPGNFSTIFEYPFSVVVRLLIHPETYKYELWIRALLQAWDAAAIVALFGVATMFALKFRWDTLSFAGLLFGLSVFYLASCSTQTIFGDVFNFGRVFAPMFVLTLARAFDSHVWTGVWMSSIISLRIGLFFIYPVISIMNWLMLWTVS